MNKFLAVAVAALLVGFGVGYSVFSGSGGQESGLQLGAISVPSVATTTHGTAGQSALTYGWQYNVVESLGELRAPFSGILSTNVNMNFPAIDNSTTTFNVTSTALTGAAVGDIVVVDHGSSTALTFIGDVVTANEVRIIARNAATSSVDAGDQVMHIKVIPFATFLAPDTLKVSTSTTPYLQ